MSKVKIQGNASGTGIFTVAAPATNTDRTITLPDIQGTAVVADSNNRVGLGTSILPTDASLITSSGIKMNITNPGQRRVYALGQTSDNYTLNLSGGAAVLFDRISGSDEIAFETHYTGYWHREQMRITKEGYVKMPYQPAWSGRLDGTRTTSGIFPLAATFINRGNYWANNRFTVPVAGAYEATMTAYTNYTNGYGWWGIFINGGAQNSFHFNNGGYTQHTGAAASAIFSLSTNDYIEFGRPADLGGGYFDLVYASIKLIG